MLPAAAESVGQARRWAAQQLEAWFPHHDELADDLSVVVSELVTNSVEAGAHSVSVALDAHTRGVDLAVSDDAPGLPRVGDAAAGDTGGRGLAIVAALSASWEVVTVADRHGKTVWATLVTADGGRVGFDCTSPAA